MIVDIIKKIHLVNNLKINMLININILVSKCMILNMNQRIILIDSCRNITIKINVMFKKNSNAKRVVLAKFKIVILSQTLMNIFILVQQANQLFNDWKLIFELCYNHDLNQSNDLYTYIVNANLSFVQLKNVTDRHIIIQHHARLKKIVKFSEKECFLVNLIYHSLTITDWRTSQMTSKKREEVTLIITITVILTQSQNMFN